MELLPYSPEHFSALCRFNAEVWKREGDADYLRWRYAETPNIQGIVALEGARIAAITFARRQRYFSPDQAPLSVLELIDWAAHPDFRGQRLGMRVFQAMTEGSEQLITIGGTAITQKLLPRMGWRAVCSAPSFILPLAPEALDAELSNHQRAQKLPLKLRRLAVALSTELWFKRAPKFRAPEAGRSRSISKPGEEVLALYEGSLLSGALPDLERISWLQRHPRAGRYLSSYFELEGQLKGWSLARCLRRGDRVEAQILDIFTQEAELYPWMIAETLRRLLPEGPQVVRSRASDPALISAFKQNRFIQGPPLPVHWFEGEGIPLRAPLHFSASGADEDLLPV